MVHHGRYVLPAVEARRDPAHVSQVYGEERTEQRSANGLAVRDSWNIVLIVRCPSQLLGRYRESHDDHQHLGDVNGLLHHETGLTLGESEGIRSSTNRHAANPKQRASSPEPAVSRERELEP